MTFVAVGISLMLFGSIQMMSAGIQETLVGGIEEDQNWDAQVYEHRWRRCGISMGE